VTLKDRAEEELEFCSIAEVDVDVEAEEELGVNCLDFRCCIVR
jgi:hypothetical protein